MVDTAQRPLSIKSHKAKQFGAPGSRQARPTIAICVRSIGKL
jgi:hypothetical protein